jgi:subtilase family serine protease
LIGGTSAACPIFASIISLVNDRLLAAGDLLLLRTDASADI